MLSLRFKKYLISVSYLALVLTRCGASSSAEEEGMEVLSNSGDGGGGDDIVYNAPSDLDGTALYLYSEVGAGLSGLESSGVQLAQGSGKIFSEAKLQDH